MEDVRIKFYGTRDSEDHNLEVFCNKQNEIYIDISIPRFEISWITLNKATAVQLVKKLKLEISKIDNHEQ
jgi:hypothetical protein